MDQVAARIVGAGKAIRRLGAMHASLNEYRGIANGITPAAYPFRVLVHRRPCR